MIEAKDLAQISMSGSNYKLPESFWDYLKQVAESGEMIAEMYVDSELALPMCWSDDKTIRHKELCKFRYYMESLGYQLEFLYSWGNSTRYVDAVRITWCE